MLICLNYPLSWSLGVTNVLAGQNDFLQGDFYGNWLEGSFVCKLLYTLKVLYKRKEAEYVELCEGKYNWMQASCS